MTYIFSKKSIERMNGVHPKLISCVDRALSYGVIDITVLPDGGVRSLDRQRDLVKSGASKTIKSKHIKQDDGYGHAIDIAPYPIDWRDINRFLLCGTVMFRAAAEEGIIIRWGGHWKEFKDYPHFEIVGSI